MTLDDKFTYSATITDEDGNEHPAKYVGFKDEDCPLGDITKDKIVVHPDDPILWDEDRPKELPLAELREWLFQCGFLNHKQLAAKKDAEAREKWEPVRPVSKLDAEERGLRRRSNRRRLKGQQRSRKRHGRTTSTHR